MRFFTQIDVSHAVAAMLASGAFQDVRFLGTMSGIKRRARARAIIEFAKHLDPAPEDYSITTMRLVLQELFGKGVSNTLLHLHFSTPKRKANDRVDVDRLNAWLNTHRERFLEEANCLMRELDAEWPLFTHAAAHEAGQQRREEAKRIRGQGADT